MQGLVQYNHIPQSNSSSYRAAENYSQEYSEPIMSQGNVLSGRKGAYNPQAMQHVHGS
jgi:hypothetical protein